VAALTPPAEPVPEPSGDRHTGGTTVAGRPDGVDGTACASTFLQAAWGASTPTAPIWLMRQAGRYLPEYRRIKERYGFWCMCRTPEIATEVTLQPVRRFPVDAAILFSDIMTPLPAMGVDIEFAPGPVIRERVASDEAVRRLRTPQPDEIAPFVGDALQLLRQVSPVPVIGFGGAPLTLATYLVEGGGPAGHDGFPQWVHRHPQLAHQLLERLTDVSIVR
jgi:uroporphyrinogen decarboxylase